MKIRRHTSSGQSGSDGTMSVSGHLKELRNRIIICIAGLVVFFLLGLHFAPAVVDNLTDIGKQYGYAFVYIAPQELLLQYFGIAMIAGICLALPLILYHIWAFIQPGLKENENGLFLGAMVFGLIFFVLGVLFCYKIMMPFMLRFLIELSRGSNVTASVSVASYITFLMTSFLVMGIIFELPVVSVTLTQLGLLKVEWMKKTRKLIIVAVFIVAAVITPPDIVSQIMVAFPMLGLYEVSVIICGVLEKTKKEKRRSQDAEES